MQPTAKLRVLCLHGYQQNGAIFREKSGGFRSSLKKYFDFVFMTAPHSVELQQTNGAGGALADTVPVDFRGWWYVPECYNTKEVKDFEGFEESVQAVVDFAKNEGPFDGLLGFSQGATLAFLIAALRQKGVVDIDFKFLILICGFPSRYPEHQELNKVALRNLPCLHVYGQTDKIISHELSAKLVHSFDKDKVVVIEHPGGHMMPNLSKYRTATNEFLEIIKNISNNQCVLNAQ